MYRVYTEDVEREAALQLASKYFEGFTHYAATGYWHSHEEKSQVFEIAGNVDRALVYDFAVDLKDLLNQQNVLVVEVKSDSTLV